VIAFLAESSPQIGTGHIKESFSLIQRAQANGIATETWINGETPRGLLEQAPCQLYVVDGFSRERLGEIGAKLRGRGARLVVTNFRRVNNDQVRVLRDCGLRVACVDDLGNRHLDCDLIINPSIVTNYHRYSSNNPDFRLHAGPAYLMLAPEYQELHGIERHFAGPVHSIVVAMGGIDRPGTTVRIVESLLDWRQDVTCHIILGAGFKFSAELQSNLSAQEDGRFYIYENLPSLASMLFAADIGFTGGGNTLYEMACVGTPALVLFDEEHEGEQGKALQDQGSARCLGHGPHVPPEQIRQALEEFDDPQRRELSAKAGRSLVDGKGVERVFDLLMELV